MSRQPYTYSMPESFLKDKSVPARWRVLGIINGFILNGGCFYGSNEWLQEQLSCSEPTVSAAFAELDTLNLIEVRRTSRTRKVYRKENDPSQFGSLTQVEPDYDPSQLLPNSVSNSEKNTSDLEDSPRPQIVEVPVSSDSEEYSIGAKSPRISGDKRKAYDELIAWSENERGFEFPKTTRLVQYKAFKLANENQIPRERLMEVWEEMSCDKFWQKEGFDWMNVVHKCLKKPV